jgi:hypothetical protein
MSQFGANAQRRPNLSFPGCGAVPQRLLALALASLFTLVIGSFQGIDALAEEIPLDKANVYAELNETDGDLGFHALIDGEGWKRLKIIDPEHRTILDAMVKGRLGEQGLTELFFESAEPGFDELTPEEFFDRFPEGIYEIEGVTIEGDELDGDAEFTHVMPAPPVVTAPALADCDMPTPIGAGDLTITWDPVTTSHTTVGANVGSNIGITGYEISVEREDPEPVLVYKVDLSETATSLTVPAAFMSLGDVFKFAVLVRESSGNQTSVEGCVMRP